MGGPQTKAPELPIHPDGDLGGLGHGSPLTPQDSVQGVCLQRGQGHPLCLCTQTLFTQIGAEPPPALQSPELLGPGPLGQQSAASMWLSHHGFLQVLQHLKRYICARSLGSDHISGDLQMTRPRVLGKRVHSPPRMAGTNRPGPWFPGVRCAQKRHRSFVLLLWHTHGFSILFSGKMVLCQVGCVGCGDPWVGVGSGCFAGMRPFILTSSCGNGSRGEWMEIWEQSH